MKWVLCLGMVAGIALSATLWSRRMPSVPNADWPSPTPSSGDSAASPKRTVQGIGYVEPVSEIRKLAFKLDGVVGCCSTEIGKRVAQGDVLMTLADHEELAAVAVAETQLAGAHAERERVLAGVHPRQIAAAESKVKRLGVCVRQARKHYNRIAKLHGSKSSTESERDEAESELLQAEAAVAEAEAELAGMNEHVRPVDRAVAEANVAQAESQLSAARARLDETVLRAPSDGIVLDILRREGEASRGPQGEPVMIFADDSRLRVRAEIDERSVSLLQAGQPARVFGRGLGPARYEGRIAVVKQVMGDKTVFSRASSERKDLDVLQVLIDMPETFRAPLGLQVDVEIGLQPSANIGDGRVNTELAAPAREPHPENRGNR